ncbi:MAG: hypothetical protein JXB24_05940 [Bacteroidales bacterium]|nr:hypothetical protein [Bacteroidales bacterium]
MRIPVFLWTALCICFSALRQDLPAQTPDAKQNYKVYREYDENGNLIQYDSTSVYVWSSNSNDFFTDPSAWLWNEDSLLTDSSDFLKHDPFFFGFQFPGDEFFLFPDLHFGHDFEEFDRIMREFHENFDFFYSDSAFHYGFPGSPGFEYHGKTLPENEHQELYIEKIEKRMEEMRRQQEKMFREFFDHEYFMPPSSPFMPDSIQGPGTSPEKEQMKYDPSLIPI